MNLQDYLIYKSTQEKDTISNEFASFINHYYGNMFSRKVIIKMILLIS